MNSTMVKKSLILQLFLSLKFYFLNHFLFLRQINLGYFPNKKKYGIIYKFSSPSTKLALHRKNFTVLEIKLPLLPIIF